MPSSALAASPELDPYTALLPPISWSSVLGLTFGFAYLSHRILVAFDKPLLSPFEILWNCFVFLMPAGIVTYLAPASSHAPSTIQTSVDGAGASQSHAAKSEVLRKVFRLDGSHPSKNGLRPAAPPGLGNWDNSCYQNSVLQALASLRNLQEFWKHRQGLTGEPLPESTTAVLQGLVRGLNDHESRGRKLWTPSKLKSMSSWQQQDAQEYFSKIMDELDKDTIRALRGSLASVAGGQPTNGTVSKTTTMPEALALDGAQSQSGYKAAAKIKSGFRVLENPLEGLLAQRVGCTRCGYTDGLSLIPFNCITLPLGRQWSYSTDGCLDEFTSLEYIEGVECAKCTLLNTQAQLQQFLETSENHAEENDGRFSSDEKELTASIRVRLQAISDAIADEDFEEDTLAKKCRITSKMRTSSVKSRQAIIMKAPRCLVLHVNRSLFDEHSGAQLKNYADVRYPLRFDFSRWCAGNSSSADMEDSTDAQEYWEMDPSKSMIQDLDQSGKRRPLQYVLRAVVTHYGRHENGHYVCYRRVPSAECDEGGCTDKGEPENWWRLSDEVVTPVSESDALDQGGAFMLFYERVDEFEMVSESSKVISESTITNEAGSTAVRLSEIGQKHDEAVELTSDALAAQESAESLKLPSGDEGSRLDQAQTSSDTTHGEGEGDQSSHASEDDTTESSTCSAQTQIFAKQKSPVAMRTAGARLAEDHAALAPIHIVATT